LLSLSATSSAYTIVQTAGNRSTGVDGMKLPLFTVQLADGETLTDEQKVQAYKDWEKATSDHLATTGDNSPAAFRDAM
ncbi:hypothetical protein PFISCL1PPCAC_11626, partial [Pristionchus fissidentatus]